MRLSAVETVAAFAVGMALLTAPQARAADGPNLDAIDTIVILYAENRSFDNLYGLFPGANGLGNLSAEAVRQVDRDGTPLPELPAIWNGLTSEDVHVHPPIPQDKTAHLPNTPFAIDDPKGFNLPLAVATRDLVHRFYQNQMQINGGKNDRFAAYSDAGALTMGHYNGEKLAMWQIARRYVLADNFFMGAFGGSFMNHIYLACACVGRYPNADHSPAASEISAVEADGITLELARSSPGSALGGPPHFVADKALTPDFFAVNTMQPSYLPSGVAPAKDGYPLLADPSSPQILVPQREMTIGDLLSAKGVSWAYYSGAWQITFDAPNYSPSPNFQYHHQPFNYFASFAPGTTARAEHIRDGGLFGVEFIKGIDEGNLPQVTFYKPQGNLTQHSGYSDVMAGDQHLADIVGHLERSPQWPHMVVIVTYDENGGYWDHVPPPTGDRWGPGMRIPAIIASPLAKRGAVDHTLYDTGSILRFITKRFNLPMLAGLKARDDARAREKLDKIGDLTGSLDLAAD